LRDRRKPQSRKLFHGRRQRTFAELGGQRVFCNPPYSKIGDWVKKCYEEAIKPETLVVMLIPARTDTRYFHDYIIHRSEVRFVKGRLKFGDSKNAAPFPSMVVIFRAAGVQ
jgi:site-specific DNA-methyltransferase (adenine-specific)